MTDDEWMGEALFEAQAAATTGDVPVGAPGACVDAVRGEPGMASGSPAVGATFAVP